MHRRCFFLAAVSAFCSLPLSIATVSPRPGEGAPCSVFLPQAARDCPVPRSPVGLESRASPDAGSSSALADVFHALAVLQDTYFDAVKGTWPTSIDWTGAVVETIVSGTLTTLSRWLGSVEKSHDWAQKEQLISSLFAHVAHSFFGQNAIGILDEAYDDVLWVVLGWLEAVEFVNLHSKLHFGKREQDCLNVSMTLESAIETMSWHGNHWVCAFADRARAFWDFASKGWDTKLCHGGMNWNPKLEPYKNAITNELWIAASTSMYQHFPADRFNQSWVASKGLPTDKSAYMAAAVVGYKWLKGVNMTNSQGLYTDGFHVDKSKPGNVECDQRDEMVYTYNQGVILTGQRGLYTLTGSPSYLAEGHALIQAVINATGWDMARNKPVDEIKVPHQGLLPPSRGLGRYGILEENCDAKATCSQDGQTFKGIFFHHLTAFCAPLDPAGPLEGRSSTSQDDHAAKLPASHANACAAYLGWVKHNVDAAMGSRDAAGRFGMWWGASIFAGLVPDPASQTAMSTQSNMTDYRNKGTPLDRTWSLTASWHPGTKSPSNKGIGQDELLMRPDPHLRLIDPGATGRLANQAVGGDKNATDANDRGRGRTVETHVGGLALLRAYWELSQI